MDTLRVLIVDDELGMRLGIRKALQKMNIVIPEVEGSVCFEVDMTDCGEEAIEKITMARPDILLLDYKLPKMSGLDVLDKVAMNDDEMVTLMLTAYASIDIAITAIKRGAFDFIAKPFTPDELKKTITKAAQSLILARQVRKLAEEKRQVRFEFIKILGHELKSPLNAIEGYLLQMEQHLLGNDLSDYDQAVGRSLTRINGMRKLIADLLDLTRIESGQRIRSIEPVNLYAVAEDVLETNQVDAEARKITSNLSCDKNLRIQADAEEMRLILNNLISNAVKYNKDGGSIDVRISKEGDLITISVEDTGIGLSEAEAAKLFQEFVRIKNQKTKDIQGSGLGLTLLKKIATLYHGGVALQSQPDAGTTVTVTLRDTP